MARKAREKSSTGKYILMLKGIESNLFRSKKNKEKFSELVSGKFGENLFGIRFFCDKAVMVLKESDKGIGLDMKPILISFARAYNRDGETDGKVFADRFKSIPIEDDAFMAECMAYINGEKVKDPFAQKTDGKVQTPKPKTAPKPKAEPKPEKEPEPVVYEKPKRKNDMPTWLL